jgi:hypothetical protein
VYVPEKYYDYAVIDENTTDYAQQLRDLGSK